MASTGKRVDKEEKLLQASRKGDLEAVLVSWLLYRVI